MYIAKEAYLKNCLLLRRVNGSPGGRSEREREGQRKRRENK